MPDPALGPRRVRKLKDSAVKRLAAVVVLDDGEPNAGFGDALYGCRSTCRRTS
jgi:hypothetical protein